MALVYTLKGDDTYEVSAGSCDIGSVTIPSTYLGKAVTSIAAFAFSNCSTLTDIIIPNSITSIGVAAFVRCQNLLSATIPNSITSLSPGLFDNCSSLVNVAIPNSITSIGNRAFLNCISLTNITIPDSVINVGEGIFENCQNLISIKIPNSVISIGNSLFVGCLNLTNVTMSNSLTSIPQNTFGNCTNLINVNIPNSAISIGVGAFASCVKLPNITIPNSVTSIGAGAFYNCLQLNNITIPNSVISIGDSAFFLCQKLLRVNFMGNCPTFGTLVFNSASPNLKLYRKKNFVTGWTDSVQGVPVVLWSDNVIKSIKPFNLNGISQIKISNASIADANGTYIFYSNYQDFGDIFVNENGYTLYQDDPEGSPDYWVIGDQNLTIKYLTLSLSSNPVVWQDIPSYSPNSIITQKIYPGKLTTKKYIRKFTISNSSIIPNINGIYTRNSESDYFKGINNNNYIIRFSISLNQWEIYGLLGGGYIIRYYSRDLINWTRAGTRVPIWDNNTIITLGYRP